MSNGARLPSRLLSQLLCGARCGLRCAADTIYIIRIVQFPLIKVLSVKKLIQNERRDQTAGSGEKHYSHQALQYSNRAGMIPKEERYGLTSQIRRSVVSIPSNISKGYGRKTTLDYVRMLCISYGSVCELETQILLAGDLYLIEKGEIGTLNKAIAEIERMLKALIKSLENKPSNP